MDYKQNQNWLKLFIKTLQPGGKDHPTAITLLSFPLPYICPLWTSTLFHAPSIMARHFMITLFLTVFVLNTNGYWLMGAGDFITTERIDPIVNPGMPSGHVHSVVGASNFGMTTSTARLRQSQCTSIPIPQDKSNYWFPHLYFQWSNGSFTSLNGGAVIYYLFNDKPGTTTAFPDDFRMLSGDPTLRTYNPNSFAQQAVSYICLDFSGVSSRHDSLPTKPCPSGIRSQINFPSCWDGKNLDSPDHKSHVAFLSGGPDSGSCSDPKYPVTIPRIFLEVYWSSSDFDKVRSQAMNPDQPFVFSMGDPTGYGFHADFFNGWEPGVLQNAVDKCHCNQFGDPTCCADQGIFSLVKGQKCQIPKTIDEPTTGTLAKLPGNNPVRQAGAPAPPVPSPNTSTSAPNTNGTPSKVEKPIPSPSGGPAQSGTTIGAAAAGTSSPPSQSSPKPTPSTGNAPPVVEKPAPPPSGSPAPGGTGNGAAATGPSSPSPKPTLNPGNAPAVGGTPVPSSPVGPPQGAATGTPSPPPSHPSTDMCSGYKHKHKPKPKPKHHRHHHHHHRRSAAYARAFHENGRRFTKSHARAV